MSITSPIGEIDRNREKYDISYVMKQKPVPVFHLCFIDRDLNDERLYHLIVWPAKSIAPKWKVNNVPHLPEDGLDLNEEILRI